MTIHADLIRYVEETFLPSLGEPYSETARLLYTQIRRLEALRSRLETVIPDAGVRAEVDKEVSEIATAVRDAYGQLLKQAEASKTS